MKRRFIVLTALAILAVPLLIAASKAKFPHVVCEALSINGVQVTSTATELNALDGITATVAELNYTDVTPGAVTASKAIVANSAGKIDAITLFPPTNGGTGNVVNKFTGIPKLAGFAVAGSTNGTTNTVGAYIDETPAGEWTGTTNVTDSTESTTFRKGTASLKLAFTAAAVAGNGADNTLSGGDQDWTDDESVGLWVYSSAALTAGDVVLEITDSVAAASLVDFPAVAANTWTWCELDISGVENTSKDVIQSIAIDLSTAGATAQGAFNLYCDYMWKWDGATEEALGIDIYEDGVVAAFGVVTAAAGANTPILLAEGTDFIVHYETGNDFLIAVTDQSANSIHGLAALE
ncbi:MAG: hypothetical protein IT364_24560 [Candidatus Hydrogenedentes bacterium]|nr:hypothetical protein [Candidatus Hydrogenedentota bacterium]